jgi:uncharacterized protein YcbX
MHLGTLRGLYRYPVKSLRGETLHEAYVDASGLEGDRERALIAGEGQPREGRPYRGKDDQHLHTFSAPGDAIDHAISADLSLSEPNDERFFDDSPVSLIVDRWLDGVSSFVDYRVEYQRFRPNFFVESAGGEVLDEAALTGRELQLGDVTLRVRYPIERCVVITYDADGENTDPRILRYIAQARSAWMGIYCDVPRAGIVRIGDSLSLIER